MDNCVALVDVLSCVYLPTHIIEFSHKPISKIQPVVTKWKPIWKQAKKKKDPKEKKPPEVAPISSIDILGKGKKKRHTENEAHSW